LEELIR